MKKIITIFLSIILMTTSLSGCSHTKKPSPENPVTLTLWHVYGSQTTSPLNNIIDEFNKTVGKENGITINIVSVTSSSAIDSALAASANNEPGAVDMPDIFIAYPRVVEIVGRDNLLTWNNYFTDEELSLFNEEFLSEGYFDNELLMLPIAKSSEAFFINQTLFERFSTETGVNIDTLETFNGIFETANIYYDWSGGQNFIQINDYYNYAYIGMKAFNSEFIIDGQLQLESPEFEKVWTPLAKAAIYGGICLEEGYAAARWKTIEIISNTGSTADVLYQPDHVIYPDNSTEEITTLALPYPVFTKENPCAVYRGGGMFAVKSDDERKNYAAYIFAKWLTEKEQNLEFVTSSGYLPVTDDSLDTLFSDITIIENESYQSLYQALGTMNKSYTFYSLPLYEGASNTQLTFEQNVKTILKAAHNQYIARIGAGENADEVLNELIDTSLNELITLYTK